MNWHLSTVVFFTSFSMLALIILLERMTTSTSPTVSFLLSLRVLLWFSKHILTPTLSNISILTIFFQITSMASVQQDLWGIFFPILLILGHPLLGTSENHSSLLFIDISKAFDSLA